MRRGSWPELDIAQGRRTDAVRRYASLHGENDLHRYTRRGGKQAAEVFHRGTLGEGMRAAIEAIKRRYQPMIEAWRKA